MPLAMSTPQENTFSGPSAPSVHVEPSGYAQELEGCFPGCSRRYAALPSYKARCNQEMLRCLGGY